MNESLMRSVHDLIVIPRIVIYARAWKECMVVPYWESMKIPIRMCMVKRIRKVVVNSGCTVMHVKDVAHALKKSWTSMTIWSWSFMQRTNACLYMVRCMTLHMINDRHSWLIDGWSCIGFPECDKKKICTYGDTKICPI